MPRKSRSPQVRRIRTKDPIRTWREHPDLVRQFLERRPDYEQLCAEVAYILKKRLADHNVEISTITWRAKTVNSFLEKIQRKGYNDPFTEIKDFSGIRVIYLYKQDEAVIEEIIREEFEILEKVDKLAEKGTDRFGYLATHFIAKLGQASSGARYEDLKNLIFELQVRTVLQDAWTIIDHHLAYKKESEIPKHLHRKLTRMASWLEDADESFDQIRQGIEKYVNDLKESQRSTTDFLNHDLDLDSFLEYLSWKFVDLPKEKFDGQAESFFEGIDKNKYSKLLKIEQVVKRTTNTRTKVNQIIEENNYEEANYAGGQVAIALGIVDKSFRECPSFSLEWKQILEKELDSD